MIPTQSENWLPRLKQAMRCTKGYISLYHSSSFLHPTRECRRGLCKMQSTGSAGSVFSRAVLRDIMDFMCGIGSTTIEVHN